MYKRSIDNIDLYLNLTSFGQYDTPVIKKVQNIDFKTSFLPFNVAVQVKDKNNFGVHFFIDDYQFVRIWNQPNKYIETLKQFKYILSPDFSLYTDYPKAYQLFNHYRKHALSAFLQSKGITVIPTISWSDKESFNWCFDGIEKNSVIAVSSVGCMKNRKAKRLFIDGFNMAINTLKPTKILFFGVLPDALNKYSDLIIFKDSYQEKHRKKDVL